MAVPYPVLICTVHGFNLCDHTITGNVLDYNGTGSSSVPSPHSSLSFTIHSAGCALLCNKGCDQILTTGVIKF